MRFILVNDQREHLSSSSPLMSVSQSVSQSVGPGNSTCRTDVDSVSVGGGTQVPALGQPTDQRPPSSDLWLDRAAAHCPGVAWAAFIAQPRTTPPVCPRPLVPPRCRRRPGGAARAHAGRVRVHGACPLWRRSPTSFFGSMAGQSGSTLPRRGLASLHRSTAHHPSRLPPPARPAPLWVGGPAGCVM